MNSDKENGNVFRFSLYQENILFCEKMFDADQFNPFTRYSINIKKMLPATITKFQKVLSKRKYDVVIDVGENKEYDLLNEYKSKLNLYPKDVKDSLKYSPETKVSTGAELRITFTPSTGLLMVFFISQFK